MPLSKQKQRDLEYQRTWYHIPDISYLTHGGVGPLDTSQDHAHGIIVTSNKTRETPPALLNGKS